MQMNGQSPRPACFEHVADEQWNDWRWQLKHRLSRPEDLEGLVALDAETREEIRAASEQFLMGITPYYASLMQEGDLTDPIYLQAVPQGIELARAEDELEDPLAEDTYMPTEGLTHRYPDRALLYTSHNCPVYCRHCNRRRKVGDPASALGRSALDKAVDYVRQTPAIRDLLVSGGDPLSLSDKKLDILLTELRGIKHLEIIRLATRNPVTLPQRITPELIEVLKKHHPIYISTHFNHLRECTPEAELALNRLADGGCVISNQMVLLKGVNDDPAMVKEMNRWLLARRCRPYYIFQCDSVEGVSHFKTPVRSGLKIIEELRGWTSGLAVPHYVVDLPEGGGKVPLLPEYLVSQNGNKLTFKNYAGEVYNYVEGAEPKASIKLVSS